MKRYSTLITLFSFILMAIFLLSGCGYTLYGAKEAGVRSVSIGRIENTSGEPRLEDMLVAALADELSRQGIALSKEATRENQIYGGEIHGVINRFELTGIAESGQEVFTEYEVRINGAFFLRTPEGKDIPLKGENPFIVTFPSRADLSRVFAAREQAVKEMLKGLSAEIVSGLVYAQTQ